MAWRLNGLNGPSSCLPDAPAPKTRCWARVHPLTAATTKAFQSVRRVPQGATDPFRKSLPEGVAPVGDVRRP